MFHISLLAVPALSKSSSGDSACIRKKRGRDCCAPFAANRTVGDGRRSSCPSLHSAGGHFSPPHLRLSFLLALPLPIPTSVDVIFYYECVTEFCLLGNISETIFLWIYSLLSFCSSPLTQSTLPSFRLSLPHCL